MIYIGWVMLSLLLFFSPSICSGEGIVVSKFSFGDRSDVWGCGVACRVMLLTVKN